jgi:hypothetical protein
VGRRFSRYIFTDSRIVNTHEKVGAVLGQIDADVKGTV